MKFTKIISPTEKLRHHNSKGYVRIKRNVVIQQASETPEKLGIPQPNLVTLV